MIKVLKNFLDTFHSFCRRVFRKIKRVADSACQKFTPLDSKQAFNLAAQEKFYRATFPDQPTLPNSLALGASGRTDAFLYRLTGHAKGHYSLAIVNRALAMALNRLSSNQACFIPFDDGIKKTLRQMPEILDRELCAVIDNSIPTLTNKPIISIVHHYPVITDDESADVRLIIFFWEESAVPEATVTLLNEKFDAILVAAVFVANALRNSGCIKPIFIIPMGIDHLIDYSEPLMSFQEITASQPFRFLHVSSVFERKGPEFLLAAFIQQFDADDNVELYIKTFPNPHNQIHEQLAHFSATKKNPPRVIIDETDASIETLQAIYRSAHTLVLPTRGEGFNLPAAEAMALGLPVIVTGFGAHIDFCTTQTALLIPFRFDFSQSHLKKSDSCWLTPDTNGLSSLLQQAVNEVITQSERLKQRREAGYALIRSTYTWDRAVEGLTNAVHWLSLNQPAKQSNEQNVVLQYKECASLDDLKTFSFDNGQTDAVIFKLGSCQIKMPIPDSVLADLYELSERVIILLELTSATDSLPDGESFSSKQAFLKAFDRVIVQTLVDVNEMLAAGEAGNVVFLPVLSDEPLSHEMRRQRIFQLVIGLKYDRQLLQS